MQKKPVNEREFNLLISAAKQNKSLQKSTREKLITAYTLLYYTACRADEIRLFSASDIQTLAQKGELTLAKERTKTKRARIIRVSDRGREAISNLQVKEPFESAKGGVIGAAAFKRLLNTHIHAVLGEHYSSHSFRAGAATRLCSQGLIKAAQIHLGHRSAATTLIYQRLSEAEFKQALERAY
ncbi:MAG: site-specific integrase [Campylobacteraceae bacterium]|jgi:integrase|nr:site-specific integrase [Campylobacteraceae bacterium]